jgi:hypothetical protein
MRDWKCGELQAVGAGAKLLILGGGFVVLFTSYLDFDVSRFLNGLPGTLITSPFTTLLGGAVALTIGCLLGIWLWRVRRRTGISTQPFDRRGNP